MNFSAPQFFKLTFGCLCSIYPRPSALILGAQPSAPTLSAVGLEMEIIKIIFGKDIEKCLADNESIEEFEQKLSQFYEYVSLSNTRLFDQYFKKYKEVVIKYHVMKGAVRACELSDDSDKFYNNLIEAINKLIKIWQNF